MHRKGMHACTQGTVHACMHAHWPICMCTHRTMHICTHKHHHACMHACTPAHMYAGVHTQNTGSCVHKAPCKFAHPCAHTHTQVLVGLCLYSNPRRPAELRGRRREGREEERRARGELGESLSSWLVGHFGGPSLVAAHSKPKPPHSSDCSHPVTLSYPDLSPLS